MLGEVLCVVILMGNFLRLCRVIFVFNEYFKSLNDIIIEMLFFIFYLEISGEMKYFLLVWGLL